MPLSTLGDFEQAIVGISRAMTSESTQQEPEVVQNEAADAELDRREHAAEDAQKAADAERQRQEQQLPPQTEAVPAPEPEAPKAKAQK